jgi:hypothetical protein
MATGPGPALPDRYGNRERGSLDECQEGGAVMYLKEAIVQLEKCQFECEGGYLENNVAFIGLKNLAAIWPTIVLPGVC